MPLICCAPGSQVDPLQQSRKLGVYLSLSSIALTTGPKFDSPEFLNQIAEALKEEFTNCLRDYIEGKRVSVVRWLPDAEIVPGK